MRPWNIGRAIRQRSYMAKQAERAGQPPPPPSTSIPLAAFASGPATAVRVSVDRHEGRQFVNVRSWYRNKTGEWKPTLRGVTVRIEDLPALADAISKAIGLGAA